ncbi:MAG: adenine phosphoribosyltransferase [Firmicutes bacterium]|nr:adenine phosphoribosyltransferase [Bacillota bacterium]
MDLKELIRVIPDFPKPGISFKDITTLLRQPAAYHQAIDELADKLKDLKVDVVVGPEARGFVVASALAYRLETGLVPVRKSGKLPFETVKVEYNLEYGTDRLEMHSDAIQPGQRVVVADDLLATGGTIGATINLVEQLGGKIVAAAFLIELGYLRGRERLADYNVVSLIEY